MATIRSDLEAAAPTLLSPKEFAQALGVSESSVKRWVDDGRLHAGRTAGGHRRIATAEAVQFARKSGLTIARPDMLGLPARPARGTAATLTAEGLGELLQRGDAAGARAAVMGEFLAGTGVAEIVDGPLREALDGIGELWRHDVEGIATEHRALDICLGILAELRRLLDTEPLAGSDTTDETPHVLAPLAIGGAPSGDPYLLPSLSAACVVSEAGYRATNLGPDTPLATLLEAARRSRPRLVWASCTGTQVTFPSRAEWQQLAAELAGLGAALVLGGRALPEDVREMHGGEGGHVYVCSSMRELRAFAEGLRGGVGG